MNTQLEENLPEYVNNNYIKNISETSSELKKIFFSELNLSLALPFKQRVRGKIKERSEAVIKVCDEHTNNVLKIISRSPRGALSAMAYDVLVTLLDMAYEQIDYHEKNGIEYSLDSFKVYFSNREVCERLNLNADNSQGNITEALRELREVNINVLGHVFDIHNKNYSYQDKDFSLISSMSKSIKGAHAPMVGEGVNSVSLRYVIFDKFIVDLLSSEFGVNRGNYLKLKSGKERRALSFLTAKRHIFGNVFSFEIDELASIIGDEEKRLDNKKASVKKVLTKIKNTIPGFNYFLKSVYGRKSVEILIEFNSADLLEEKYETAMYAEYVYAYGKESLLAIEFEEFCYITLREELERVVKKADLPLEYNYYKSKVDVIELAVDLALFQIIKTGYDKIKIKKLAKIILDSIFRDEVELPDGYKHFILKRNADKRKKEEQAKIQKEIEKRNKEAKIQEKQIDANYKVFFKTYVEDNPKMYDKYKAIALEVLENNPNYILEDIALPEIREQLRSRLLHDTIYEVAKNDYFENGEIITGFFNRNAREIKSLKIAQLKSSEPKVIQ
jgi:hypothetical protein